MSFQNAQIIGAGISPEVYQRQSPGVKRGDPEFVISRGELMEFARCPSRWKAGYKAPGSTAKDWGSLIDTLALDGDMSRYVVKPETYPSVDKKTKEVEQKPWSGNSNWCKEWLENHAGKEVITIAQKDKALEAVTRLRADPDICELLDCSEKQVMVTAEWLDPITGVLVYVKILLDLVPDPTHPRFGGALADFKTCRSAHPSRWAKECFSFGYAVQAALYIDVFNVALADHYEMEVCNARTRWIHAIQESFAPWETGKRILSQEFIEVGRSKYKGALTRYCRCLQSGEWPGYDTAGIDGFTTTEPESWMILDMDNFPDHEEPDWMSDAPKEKEATCAK